MNKHKLMHILDFLASMPLATLMLPIVMLTKGILGFVMLGIQVALLLIQIGAFIAWNILSKKGY